jgi:hypothetical protein
MTRVLICRELELSCKEHRYLLVFSAGLIYLIETSDLLPQILLLIIYFAYFDK